MTSRDRLTPAQELARATRGLVGRGVPGQIPVIRMQPQAELAIEPLVPRPIEMPPGVADPTRPGERMLPVLPRGQLRGSTQVITLNLNTQVSGNIIDIGDSEDRSESMTIVASIVEQVPAANTFSFGTLLIDWGSSGGIHSAIVDLQPGGGVLVNVHASALRVRAALQGLGTWVLKGSVGAFMGGHKPATRTLAASFSAAGTVDVEVPAFATAVRAYSVQGLAYTLEWRDNGSTLLRGLIPVAAGVGEAGPFIRPSISGIVRVTSALLQNVILVFELSL